MLKMMFFVFFVAAAVLIDDSTMVPIVTDSSIVANKIDKSTTPVALGTTPMDKREIQTEEELMNLMNDARQHGRPDRKAVAAPKAQDAPADATPADAAPAGAAAETTTKATNAASTNTKAPPAGSKSGSTGTFTNSSYNFIAFLTLAFFGGFIINF